MPDKWDLATVVHNGPHLEGVMADVWMTVGGFGVVLAIFGAGLIRKGKDAGGSSAGSPAGLVVLLVGLLMAVGGFWAA
ncbi:hypothetical protein OG500_07685 [Kitasatospora sp. NBC_01250]|uniref:hypothetical protein n=1 Tax=unclassified Kitasatospora TaxID=2633591 RepID=UPI002E10243A|nr:MULTISPECIES: hypothetical protein [unclassified Kitasatospora]WSJ65978.1 hypothetical protein OG294_07555 [Kitasatospora sp. NBC_01302]